MVNRAAYLISTICNVVCRSFLVVYTLASSPLSLNIISSTSHRQDNKTTNSNRSQPHCHPGYAEIVFGRELAKSQGIYYDLVLDGTVEIALDLLNTHAWIISYGVLAMHQG